MFDNHIQNICVAQMKRGEEKEKRDRKGRRGRRRRGRQRKGGEEEEGGMKRRIEQNRGGRGRGQCSVYLE